MILAAYRDSGYKTVLLIHILASIVAAVPAIAHPVLFELEKRRTERDVVELGGRVAATQRIYLIAVIVSGVVGFGLISMSDNVISWGDSWVWLSIVFWIALNGVMHGALFPAEKALAGGDEAAMAKIDMFGRVLAVLVLVLVYLMVVKPGGGGL